MYPRFFRETHWAKQVKTIINNDKISQQAEPEITYY